MAISQKTVIRPTSVSLPSDLIRKVQSIARSEDRSFSNMVTQLVRKAVANIESQEIART